MSFRALILLATSLIALAAIGSAVILVSLSTVLHSAAARMGTSVESVSVAYQALVDLLDHRRLDNRIDDYGPLPELVQQRAAAEQHLKVTLERARDYATVPVEHLLIVLAQVEVQEYLDAPEGQVFVPMGDAIQALSSLSTLNVREAEVAQRDIERLDGLLRRLVVLAAVLLVAGAVGMGVWLRVSVLGPVARMARVTRGYAAGDASTRVSVEGHHEFRDMARAFNELAEELERQREARATILAGVAHDLRNPLTALTLSLYGVRDERPLPPEPQLRALVARVRAQAGRLERMVGDLVDAALLEAGELQLQLRPVDLAEVAREAVDLYQPTTDGPMTLEVAAGPDGDGEALRVTGDPLRLSQVLNNLVSNAIKYSEPASPVRLSVARAGDEVRLSVADEGIGMTAEEVERLFVPFRRTDDARLHARGTGLGLSVAAAIVRGHGGRIEVQSEPARGSTFTVILPAAVTVAERRPPQESVEGPA